MGARRCSLLIATLVFGSAVHCLAQFQQPPPSEVIVTAAGVRKLGEAEAEQGLPVRLSAVVTFYDPTTEALFVQDRTGAVFVRGASRTNAGVRTGQLVDFEGVTEYGPYGPGVTRFLLHSQTRGRLPSTQNVLSERLFGGSNDLTWIEVQGVVQAMEHSPVGRNVSLQVSMLGNTFRASLPGNYYADRLPPHLIDARVKLRGVAIPVSVQRERLLGFELLVPSTNSIQVSTPAPPDPFGLEISPVSSVLQRAAGTAPGHRVHVQGNVTLKWTDRQIFVQDENGGLLAELIHPFPGEIGARVDLAGFPRPGDSMARLFQTEWRLLAGDQALNPVRVRMGDVRQGGLNGRLIEVEGVLRGAVRHQDSVIMTFQRGQWSFEGHLRTDLENTLASLPKTGSRVRVTGVCQTTTAEWQQVGGFQMLLRATNDLQVVGAAPWWTVPRLLVALAGVTLIAAIWLALYSRRVTALQRKYRQLFENASDLVCSLDLNGRFTSLNKAGERITGYRDSEARGRTFEDWVAPEDRDAFAEWWTRVVTGEDVPDLELSIIARDGQVVALDVSGHLTHLRGSPTSVDFIARDITARKQSEEQRRVMERKMLDGQKLESLGVMAGGIAHDFNNLLTAILGNATLAGLSTAEDSPARAHLKNIEKASRQAADLCKQLLAYSGKGRFISQRIDLNTLIYDMQQLLQISISRKATLEIAAAEKVPAIEADPSQIRQVLMNLVINASEALEDRNGVIRIRTGKTQASSENLAKAALGGDLPEGEYVFLEVSDTGVGMDRETISRIFDPFFTTKFIGRGLGLAAVSGVVRAHQGALQITSERDKGSSFRVLLPFVQEPAEIVPPPALDRSEWKGSGTVLVTDDEEGVRIVTRQMLKSLGFHVLEAANGEEAIAVFREQYQRIVAVVLDLTMPRLSGEDTFHELRRIRPDIPILLMSGFSEQEAMHRCRSHGVMEFLPKPFKPEELRDKMHAMLGDEATELNGANHPRQF